MERLVGEGAETFEDTSITLTKVVRRSERTEKEAAERLKRVDELVEGWDL